MRRRVVYLSPVGELGGAERCLLTMIAAAGAVDPDFQPYVIAGTEGPLLENARALGARTQCLPMPAALAELGESGSAGRLVLIAHMARAAPALLSYGRRLRRAVEAINPDIVHSNGVKMHLLTRFIGRGNWRLLWHIHDFLSHRSMMSRLARPASAYLDGAIAISNAVADDTRLLLPQAPVQVVLNAVDTDHFTPPPPQDASATVRVGLVATYARWKGQDVFLDAAATVLRRAKTPDIRFRIIGGPIYQTKQSQFSRQELQTRARELGIEQKVEFVDFQADPLEAYRGLDIVVHASTKPEPFGLTIAEAMSCGRTVIVSAAGGAAELFMEGYDGMGVAPGDVAGLVDTIEKLATAPALRRTLGDNARRSAVARFGMARLGRQLTGLYGNRRFTGENPLSPRADKAPSRS